MPGAERRHAEAAGDLARKPRAHGAVRVAHRVSQLHLLTTFEQMAGIADHFGIQAVRHRVAAVAQAPTPHVIGRIDLGQNRVQVEIIQMLGTAADLTQQFGAADDVIKAAEAQPRENLAHFFGDEAHQVDHLFRAAVELAAQGFVLRANAHRAGIRMALAHHDAAHGDQAHRANAIFFRTQNGGDHHVTAGLQAAIGAQLHPVAQAIQREHLVDL